ncbi:glycosyltransferase family 2 protein [Allochromatium vinosum]|uniref:glycosyltransferase family 2 protein n=1 Tax=Allochromatium vinosum TaxID=1049 RepID=UPI001903D14E|nr:glycosyltransferase family A protein [Allochromatium vinosum]
MPRFRLARLFPGRWRHLRTQARQRKIAALIAQSPYFDADFYLTHAPDVAARPYWVENPALHYLLYGALEGRRPSACFDSRWYLEQYPDVKAAGLNPLLHYLHHGRAEGRIPRPLSALTQHERLWSSEAVEAQRQSLLELETLLDDHEGCAQEASAAAWSLGRWYAWMDQWPEAARVMKHFSRIADPVPGHLAPHLLDIDAAMHVGEFGRAQARLKSLLERQPDHADLCLLAANLVQAEAGDDRDDTVIRRRLDWINRPYLALGLEPLELRPNAASSTSASMFDRIRAAAQARRRRSDAPRASAQTLVSIIIPAWNAATTLETALESLVRQTWTALEVIVVDDCSSDETAAIVERFATRDPRVRLLRHARNQGAYAARNTGLSSARGAFITTHDSDDWSHPRKIESQVRPLLATSDPVATLSHWVRTSSDLRFGQWSTPSGWMGWVHRNVSSLMFRRSVLEQLGYWDRVKVNADTEYYYRVIKAFGADRVLEVRPGVPLSFARHSPTSLTQHPETSLRSVFGGMRKDYQEAAYQWHAQAQAPSDLYVPAHPEKRPFPAPADICRLNDSSETASLAGADDPCHVAAFEIQRSNTIGQTSAIEKVRFGRKQKIEILLHIGMPKCGSSALQAYLSRPDFKRAARRRFAYLALMKEKKILTPNELQKVTLRSPRRYTSSCSVESFKTFDSEDQKNLQKKIKHIGSKYEKLIFSCEGWGFNHRFFSDDGLFAHEDFQVTILAYIRPQVEWLNSAWWQWGAWTDLNFDKWIETQKGNLNWNRLYQSWNQKHWVENVDFRLMQGDVVHDFLGYLGLDPYEHRSESSLINQSLPAPLLRLFQRHRELRAGPHDSEADFILSRRLTLASGKSPWVIDADRAKKLTDFFQAENKKLSFALTPAQRKSMLEDKRWWTPEPYSSRAAENPTPEEPRLEDLEALTVAALQAIIDLDRKIQKTKNANSWERKIRSALGSKFIL